MPRRSLAWVVLASLLGCAPPPPAPTTPPPPEPKPAPTPAPPKTLSARDIAERAKPSVVRIEGEGTLGTGFVVRADGWIATNLHVVVGADALDVRLHDRSAHAVVEVVAFDRVHDVAVVRIDVDGLEPLPLATEPVAVGDPVVAIGHPLGLSDTVSDGLISGIRDVRDDLKVLQVSAPIAPGSSGGPLIDARGEVVGIATAILREGQNLNFGIPIAYLREVMEAPAPRSLADLRASLQPKLPGVKREVPKHSLTLLQGCGEGDLEVVAGHIVAAIEVGAPVYDRGNFAACYHLYLGASLDLETKLAASCTGPRRALDAGRRRARRLSDVSAQAWAMRDTFDGLLDVIGRKVGRP